MTNDRIAAAFDGLKKQNDALRESLGVESDPLANPRLLAAAEAILAESSKAQDEGDFATSRILMNALGEIYKAGRR